MKSIRLSYLSFFVILVFTSCKYPNSNVVERERQTGSRLTLKNCKVLDNYHNTLLLECGDKEWLLDSLFVMVIEDDNAIGELNFVYYGLDKAFYGSGIYNDTIIYVYNDTLIRFLNIKDNDSFEVIYDVYVDSILLLDTLLFSVEPPYNIRFRDSILSIYSLDLNFGDVYLCILQNFNFGSKFKIKGCDEFSVDVNNYFYKLYPHNFLIYMHNGDYVKNINIISTTEFHKDDIIALNTTLGSHYMVTKYRVFWDNWLVINDFLNNKYYASDIKCDYILLCYDTVLCSTKNNVFKFVLLNDSIAVAYIKGDGIKQFRCNR